MAAKFVLAFCASALLAQANSQYLAGLGGLRSPLGYDAPCGCGAGLRGPLGYDGLCGIGADIGAASSLNAARGGGLGVTSSSAMPPTGINVASENVYEGPLSIAGNLPFLGTVAMEGVYPTVGAGAVSYGCGNGAVGITAEGISDVIAPAAIAPVAGLASPLGLGLKGYGGRIGSCGCGAIY